jgi:hypothetical protein
MLQRQMNKFLVICIAFFAATKLIAQEVPVKTQQQLENLADATEEEDLQDDSYLQQLDYLRKNPVDLNTATAGELQSIRFLTDLQIHNLLRYRTVLGKFIDIYELQAIPTWDLVTINKLLPYVTIGAATTVKESFLSGFKNGEASLLFRITRVLEKSRGYATSPSNHYLGDRNHLLLRYRYQHKNVLQYGFTADKDAGEPFFKGAQSKGFDFYSFHFFVRQLGKIKALAVGDFTVNLGQGLIEWQSLGFGKSTEILGIKRQSPVLLPYRSPGEYNFNRGAGATLQLKKVEATAFVSYKPFSGNVIDTGDAFSSFLTSGLHRTPSEIADRNSMTDFSVGGNLTYQTSNIKIGINTAAHQFSKALQKRNDPYNYHAFNGKNLWNASIDYSYTHKNVHVFGEAAIDKNRNNAFVNGALISVDPKVDVAVLHRTIQKEYQTLFGNAFTENVLPANETGTYAGLVLRPLKGWTLNAYADLFKFPWLRYRADAPGAGKDYLVQIDYQPDNQSQVYVLYRSRAKPLNESGTVTNYPLERPRQSFRLHVVKELNPVFTLKARTEMLWYDKAAKDAEEGFLGFIEGTYKLSKLQSNLRLQYFETTGYNSRIYAYENDVLYGFSVPAFFDKGFRYYLNLNYDISRQLTAWVRWAQTIYKNRESVGSALDEIAGNKRTEVKLQLVLSF